jgi:hypothetical protein
MHMRPHCFRCVVACVCVPLVARQQLGKYVPAATNTHVSCLIKFPMFSERKVGSDFFPEFLLIILSFDAI